MVDREQFSIEGEESIYAERWEAECYNGYLEETTWTRMKGNDIIISYTIVVSVSTLYGRHLSLAFLSYTITCLPHGLWTDFL